MSVQLKNQPVPFGACLQQASGNEKGRIFELHAARLTLGRSPECDVVLDVEGVSRVHALLVNSDGSWFIRDNNSKNGVFVNGQQQKESWLETGDMVQLGTFVFRFEAGQLAPGPHQGDLPIVASASAAAAAAGGMDLGIPGAAASKRSGGPNRRVMIYIGVLVVLGGVLMMGGGETPKPADPANPTESGLARDFKVADKPLLELGTKQVVPLGMEDPLLKRAEREMSKLDWSNTSLREAEQFFRRGQREYMSKNYHRAIDSFQTALSLYGGHMLAERYLRRAVYEAEIEAKSHMMMGIQYYESLQYSRAIHHFHEVVALMAHRPDEAIVKEAGRYIKQAEVRLQAAELFP